MKQSKGRPKPDKCMTMILGENSCLVLGVSYLICNSLFGLEISVACGYESRPILKIDNALHIKFGNHAIRFCTPYNVKIIANRKQGKWRKNKVNLLKIG